MIINVSDDMMRDIFAVKKLNLPLNFSEGNFIGQLNNIFNVYLKNVATKCVHSNDIDIYDDVCKLIIKSLNYYLDGKHRLAYVTFENLMDNYLMKHHLKICDQNNFYIDKRVSQMIDLKLYRATIATKADRNRLFHIPFGMYSKIGAARYSMPGFPALYLGSNLQVCCNEIRFNNNDIAFSARFEFQRNAMRKKIKIIDVGVKPQDFLREDEGDSQENFGRFISKRAINKSDKGHVRSNYVLWYPLIAACSVKRNTNNTFSIEYIIPQMMLQWTKEHSIGNNFVGIRYFSCESDTGFNFVFPAMKREKSKQFCPILKKHFLLTEPKRINDYSTIYDCQNALDADNNLFSVND